METIEWQDPPPASSNYKNTKWAPLVKTLKENPGRWALVGTFDRARAGGLIGTLKKRGLEVVHRTGDGQTASIYARAPDENLQN